MVWVTNAIFHLPSRFAGREKVGDAGDRLKLFSRYRRWIAQLDCNLAAADVVAAVARLPVDQDTTSASIGRPRIASKQKWSGGEGTGRHQRAPQTFEWTPNFSKWPIRGRSRFHALGADSDLAQSRFPI
jgi:hypothetical protein